MKRNTLTTMYHLKPGDRFYKAGDKKKTVFEKIDLDSRKTAWQTYSHFAVEVKYMTRVRTLSTLASMAKVFKSSTEVIFLRNVHQ